MSGEVANTGAQLHQEYVGFLVTPSILVFGRCQARLKASHHPEEKGRTPQSAAADGNAAVLPFAWKEDAQH